MPETRGTGLLTYTIMYGVNQGILSEETYLPIAKKGWKALVETVDTEGKMGWTPMVAEKFGAVKKKSTRGYSAGRLLMVAPEVCKYLKLKEI